ncbi:MAG TPA: aquaporin [Candidatus Tumulicola sp.]|jgi:aquaporin Z
MAKNTRSTLIGQKLAAEAVGTFLVTATAIGVDIFYYTQGNIDYSSRWLARGLSVAAVIYAFSAISGAHVDPAVTLGFVFRRVFPIRIAAGYIAAQFVGALVAAAMFLAVFGPQTLALGASHPGPHVSAPLAAATELVLTFALMLVILMTAEEKSAVGPNTALAAGFAVAACGFVGGPLSGASMNPARTIAPQLLSFQFQNIWIYLIGPIAGAGLAVAVHAGICGRASSSQVHAAKGEE